MREGNTRSKYFREIRVKKGKGNLMWVGYVMFAGLIRGTNHSSAISFLTNFITSMLSLFYDHLLRSGSSSVSP